jgi:hypothetical protein
MWLSRFKNAKMIVVCLSSPASNLLIGISEERLNFPECKFWPFTAKSSSHV